MKQFLVGFLLCLSIISIEAKVDGATSATANYAKPEVNHSAWSDIPQHLDPTFITIGGSALVRWGSSDDGRGFPIQYYGLSYILAILTAYAMLMWYVRRETNPLLTAEQVDDVVTWLVLGVVLGARLGYVVFYNLPYYLANPAEIFLPVSHGKFVGISGMSYHGGLIGATVMTAIFFHRQKLCFWKVAPIFFWVTPLAYTWGRLGNFMNGELYGRVTTSPIGMYFPMAPGELRHPSQLYEAFSEGILLFAVLTYLRRYEWAKRAMLPLYLIGYSIARFTVEFFREPDAHIGLTEGISRGQFLSMAMVTVAIIYWVIQEKTNLFTGKESA